MKSGRDKAVHAQGARGRGSSLRKKIFRIPRCTRAPYMTAQLEQTLDDGAYEGERRLPIASSSTSYSSLALGGTPRLGSPLGPKPNTGGTSISRRSPTHIPTRPARQKRRRRPPLARRGCRAAAHGLGRATRAARAPPPERAGSTVSAQGSRRFATRQGAKVPRGRELAGRLLAEHELKRVVRQPRHQLR